MKFINDLRNDLSRAVLSDKEILELNEDGILISTKISASQVQPNSIDLCLGNTWQKIKETDIIDPHKEVEYEYGRFHGEYIIQPGEFILMDSRDYFNIPNGIIGFVQGRSSIARLGLQIEQAGLVDAGFYGTITFEMLNQTKYPIKVYEGMRIAQAYFFYARYALDVYGAGKKSKYSGQTGATGSRIHLDT